MLLEACNKIWVSMLIRVSKSLLHLRKRYMKTLKLISGNWIHWHNDKKIMVLRCTNIMVKQEYSSGIRSKKSTFSD